jgi:alkylation response protein AidB-like acyl-CoA dehydrogenase
MSVLDREHDDVVRDTVRSFLQRSFSVDRRRAHVDGESASLDLWTDLVRRLGLQSIAVPEAFGGDGLGLLDQLPVLEELGRTLAPTPYLGSAVVATQLLLQGAILQGQEAWLPRLASGEVTAAVGWVPGGSPRIAGTDASGEGLRLDGVLDQVADLDVADVVVLVVDRDGRPDLAVVALDAPGVASERRPAVDPTRALWSLTLTDVQARPIGRADLDERLDRVRDLATVALATELLGAARQCLQMSVEHAGTRVQFGREIGSFQAIKHMLVDVLIDVETAALAVDGAAARLDGDDFKAFSIAASMAKASAAEALFVAARTSVQIHGAMGFTWEHDAHLYLKRALAGRPQLGSTAEHRERIAADLLDR